MSRPSTGLLFALPALIVLALLTAYPIVYTGLLSVTDAQGEFVGAENFSDVLDARATPIAFWKDSSAGSWLPSRPSQKPMLPSAVPTSRP